MTKLRILYCGYALAFLGLVYGVGSHYLRTRDLSFAEVGDLGKMASLPPLQSVSLDGVQTEVRLWWVLAGETDGATGYIVRNSPDNVATNIDISSWKRVTRRQLPTPHSGWGSFWKKLETWDLLSFPDESELETQSGAIHGIWICMEMKRGTRYKQITYNNPWDESTKEHQRISDLAAFFVAEFPQE